MIGASGMLLQGRVSPPACLQHPVKQVLSFFCPWALGSYSSCCDVEAMSLGFMSVGEAALVSQMADCAPVNYGES